MDVPDFNQNNIPMVFIVPCDLASTSYLKFSTWSNLRVLMGDPTNWQTLFSTFSTFPPNYS